MAQDVSQFFPDAKFVTNKEQAEIQGGPKPYDKEANARDVSEFFAGGATMVAPGPGGVRAQAIEGGRAEVFRPSSSGGLWSKYILPAIKEVGNAVVLNTVESALSLGTSMALWPVSQVYGLLHLYKGADAYRNAVNEMASLAYEPRTKYAKASVADISDWFAGAFAFIHGGKTVIGGKYGIPKLFEYDFGGGVVEATGKVFEELGLDPSWGERGGVLLGLATELAMFKIGHQVKGEIKTITAKHAIAKERFKRTYKQLSETQRTYVNDLANMMLNPKNLQAVMDAKKLPPMQRALGSVLDVYWGGKYDENGVLIAGGKDVRMINADIEARLLRKAIKTYVKREKLPKKMIKKYDDAIQFFLDTVMWLKDRPDIAREYIKEHYPKMPKELREVATLAHNLPPEMVYVAGFIRNAYQKIGTEGMDAHVLTTLLSNYASRHWDLKGRKGKEALTKFSPKTHHKMPRLFDTIAQGSGMGYKLKLTKASDSLRAYKHEIIKAIADSELLDTMVNSKEIDGRPMVSYNARPGYTKVTHPNMKRGLRDIFVPDEIAKDINSIFGISDLNKIKTVKDITKVNAIVKSWVLQSSLFHHLAFLRSYMLPSMHRRVNVYGAYKDGIRAIESADPVLMQGVRNGLTLGLKQDWLDALVREPTHLGTWLDKYRAPKLVKDAITSFRNWQTDFLFGELGAAWKAMTYIKEFEKMSIKYGRGTKKKPGPSIYTDDFIAKRVAEMVNNDFGGLHLERLRRNPTVQHILRLGLLAPDWTESNVRTMIKLFKGDQFERELYRHFWGGVVIKGLGMTAMLNFVAAGFDLDEMVDSYKQAWKDGNFNWMKVDVTGIYKLAGGNPRVRKYFPFIGHFLDPVKFVAHPAKSFVHKRSMVSGVMQEFITGVDYAGREFTTFEELIKEGDTVKWGGSGPVSYEQFPSYFLSQIAGSQPVQLQALISWMSGEIDGFDAFSRSLGLRTASTYPKTKRGRRPKKPSKRGGRE